MYHPVYTGCTIPPPSPWGSLPSYVSLQEGSEADARGGRISPPRRAIRDALIRAFLVVGGISAVAAWTWPGMFPQADPVAVLVRYHTPNVYTAVVAWYYLSPGVAVYLIGQFLISTSRIWFARMGVSLGSGRAFPRGRFRRRRTARRSSSGRSITRSEPSRLRAPNG